MLADDFDLPQESIDKYLPLFAKNRAADLEKISQCLALANFSEVSALAHRIKGTAAAFGHAQFGELATELEQHAKDCCLESCQEISAKLTSYFAKYLAQYTERGNS
jgi:HPt (histidine-containing phosphotransfer) domain-containing protein